jgi:predicted transporter
VTAGSSITIGLGADRAGDSVSVWLFSSPVLLGTRTVSASGEISVRIPVDTAAGTHRLAVTDASGALIGWTQLEVRAASPLAVTGGELGAIVPIAYGLLLLGGLFFALARRRIRSQS